MTLAEKRLEQVVSHLEAVLKDHAINVSEDNPMTGMSPGDYRCGCSWDSGPYSTHCEKHSPQVAAREFLRQMGQ